MTNEQKAENITLLARVVMGWTLHDWQSFRSMRKCVKCNICMATSISKLFMFCEHRAAGWDPYTSIADAMEMLDRAHGSRLDKDGPARHSCVLWPDEHRSGRRYDGTGHSLTDAICAACLEWARAQKGGGK